MRLEVATTVGMSVTASKGVEVSAGVWRAAASVGAGVMLI
jgi:hypothetical protein